MKTLSIFYLKYYKSIHHIVFVLMAFSFIKLISLFIDIFNYVFQLGSIGLFLQITILVSCYFLNERALVQAGLTPEYMAEELKKKR